MNKSLSSQVSIVPFPEKKNGKGLTMEWNPFIIVGNQQTIQHNG